MNIFKKIKIFNKVLNTVKSLKQIAENNKDHTDGIKDGFALIKSGADKIVKELPYLKPIYNEIKELLKNI